MIQNERDCRHEHVLGVARQMMTAARTAPKGKGVDVIEAALVTGEDLKKLSEKMNAMAEELGMKFFLRDAANVLQAECVVIIGTREQAQGLNCGHCGFPTCAGRTEGVPCALNIARLYSPFRSVPLPRTRSLTGSLRKKRNKVHCRT